MSKLTKLFVLIVLAIWCLASMHCKLEAVPGFDFLKICCFVESAAPASDDCDRDGCGAVEDGDYRAEEQTASAPQPLLTLELVSSLKEAALPEHSAHCFVVPRPPPELPTAWQFFQRTALPPRAPSMVA